jgi:hypothetical protein
VLTVVLVLASGDGVELWVVSWSLLAPDVGSLDGHWDGLMGLIISDLNVHMGFLWSVVVEQELLTFYPDYGCAACSLACMVLYNDLL